MCTVSTVVSQVGLCRGLPGQIEAVRKVDANCEILFRVSTYLQVQQQQTARTKVPSREKSCKVEEQLLAASHQRLGNTFLSVPLDPRCSTASKLVALGSQQIGTTVPSNTHAFLTAMEV